MIRDDMAVRVDETPETIVVFQFVLIVDQSEKKRGKIREAGYLLAILKAAKSGFQLFGKAIC